MKKTHPHTILLASAIGAASFANASNTLINGDLGTGTNWDTGAPTTVGNIGIIDGDNTGANAGILTSTNGLFIQQTGGEVNGSGIGQTFDSTLYQLIDGDFGVNGLSVTNGSAFSVSGGTADFGSSGNTRNLGIVTLGTVDVSGGVVNVSLDLTLNSTGSATDKVYNFSGGTIDIARHALSGFQCNGTANFSGSVSFTVGNTLGTNQAGVRLVNIGAGTGSITTATLEARGMSIDWTSGSGFSLTTNSLLSSNAATTWQNLWTAGQLTIDGGNVGTFGDHFQVVDNTLSLVPEPSSFALLGLGMSPLVFIRRRRHT
ncbi:MAG: PEP-CTERM sorting domain-containing protein [Verrucomicrobiae bacterium]|nr:PEP-CTERM sorting domain-containing protein [Verrucomicrobiae bacterium]